DLARLRVEPLEWACRRRAQAEVGDDDAPARVHVDPVRRPARLADAARGPVGENLGAGARLVGGPDAPVAPDDDVLRAPEADADLLEARERDRGEGHRGRVRGLSGVVGGAMRARSAAA